VHVLFITQYFTPEVGATQTRIHAFARACLARGHRVTVLTEFPNHPHGRIPPAYRGRVAARETLDGFSVVRVWVCATPEKTTGTRLALYGSFFALATAAGLGMGNPPDVVLATSPPLPVGLAGWIVARLRGARFVLDVRDLWPAAALAVGAITRPCLVRLAARLEGFLYRHADRITTVTRGFARHIAPLARDPSCVTWLPNGAADVFDPVREDPAVRARLAQDGSFLVVFAGLHGMAQGLDTVLEAAAQLRRRANVVFCLIGDGPAKARLIQQAAERGLANVRFLPTVPLADVPPYLLAADALLVPLRRHPVFDTFVPSKLYDFLACARPVILMADGEAREILETSGGGLHTPPGDAAALATAIERLLAMPTVERRRMGECGRAFVRAHFTRAAQAARLAELLEEIDRSHP
jgi:glycosyltransferase involved in cell wall biosynthesis